MFQHWKTQLIIPEDGFHNLRIRSLFQVSRQHTNLTMISFSRETVLGTRGFFSNICQTPLPDCLHRTAYAGTACHQRKLPKNSSNVFLCCALLRAFRVFVNISSAQEDLFHEAPLLLSSDQLFPTNPSSITRSGSMR